MVQMLLLYKSETFLLIRAASKKYLYVLCSFLSVQTLAIILYHFLCTIWKESIYDILTSMSVVDFTISNKICNILDFSPIEGCGKYWPNHFIISILKPFHDSTFDRTFQNVSHRATEGPFLIIKCRNLGKKFWKVLSAIAYRLWVP